MKYMTLKGKALLASTMSLGYVGVSYAAPGTADPAATAMVTAVKTEVEKNQGILWGIGAVVIVVAAIGMLIGKAKSRAS